MANTIIELKLELTEEQVKNIQKKWRLSKKEFDSCMDEFKAFATVTPLDLFEQLDWFNF